MTKLLPTVLLLFAAAISAGCATPRVDPLTLGPDMKAVIEPSPVAGFPIPKGNPVFIRFDQSDALSKQVAEMLATRGHSIASSEAEAGIIVKTITGYSFVRRQARRVTVSMGKLLDGADMNIAFSKLNNQAARMPNVNLNTTAMYAGGGLSAGGLAGATVVEMLVSMSGLGAKFNKALVGDERGVCIPMGPGGCDNWKKYEQILVFETTVTGVGASPVTFVTRARTLSEELKPIDLLNEVMPAYITAMTKE